MHAHIKNVGYFCYHYPTLVLSGWGRRVKKLMRVFLGFAWYVILLALCRFRMIICKTFMENVSCLNRHSAVFRASDWPTYLRNKGSNRFQACIVPTSYHCVEELQCYRYTPSALSAYLLPWIPKQRKRSRSINRISTVPLHKHRGHLHHDFTRYTSKTITELLQITA